jgi:ankyrin repeat protein
MSNIIKAIESNNLEEVQAVINNGAKFSKNNSPLGLAASLGNIEIVKALVSAGCKVEWGGALEPSPLCLAASEGKFEVVKFLIDNQAKLNDKDESSGFTPLMSAAASGYFEIVKLLVEAGAKINIESEHGDFALNSAARNGHNEIYEYLLPLTSSRLTKKVDISILFEKSGKPRSKPTREFTELINTINEVNYLKMFRNSEGVDEEIEKIRAIVPQIVNPQEVDVNGCTAFHHAVGNAGIILLLLEQGFCNSINIQDSEGNTPLITGCSSHDVDSVKLLLNANAETDSKNGQGHTALMKTVESSLSNEIIQLLYDAGADLEIQDNFGNTAITIAYFKSKKVCSIFNSHEYSRRNVDLLKSLGASTNKFTEVDFIHDASCGNNEGVMEFIKSGGNINAILFGSGGSALGSAAAKNHLDTLNILLENGAVVDGISNTFINIVSLGYTEIIKRLILAGVDVNIPESTHGSFALTRAIEKNNTEMVDILVKAGAKIPKKDPVFGNVLSFAKLVNPEIYQQLINK